MDETITRAEFEEFTKHMEDEHRHQERRIALLEENLEKTQAIAIAVERLATSMENMCREQERQGKRLEELEGRDGDMWRKTMGYIATTVVGLVLGFIFTQIGM